MTGGQEAGGGGSDANRETGVAEADTGGDSSGGDDSSDSRSEGDDSTGHGISAAGPDRPSDDAQVDAQASRTGVGGTTEGRPNVVVFVMDTTRAKDTVPAERAHTPTMAFLAEQGTEYTRAFSTAPWTLPSHSSLFTGTYPTKHGAHGEHTRLDGELPTLAELFRSADYETIGFSNNVWIDDQFGTARGFETFHGTEEDEVDPFHDEPEPWGGYDSLTDFISSQFDGGMSRDNVLELLQRFVTGDAPTEDKGASETVDDVQEWLHARDRADPFFCFVNCIEPHLEYRPPPAYARRYLPDGWSYADAMEIRQDPRGFDVGLYTISDEEWTVLRSLYRAEIAYLDDQIGRVVDALRATGEWEDTVFVLTSDHGENIGEHGFLGHQYCLSDTLVHVPLVVAGGPFDGGEARSDGLVQTLDLTPTLLDVAGIDAPDARCEFQGRSIHPDADTRARTAVFAEHIAPRPPIDVLEDKYDHVPQRLYDLQRTIRAVRTDQYKYVRGSDGSEELYDIVDDPGEEHDRSSTDPERATELDATLTDWLSSFEQAEKTETVSVDQATEQRLSDLGYM